MAGKLKTLLTSAVKALDADDLAKAAAKQADEVAQAAAMNADRLTLVQKAKSYGLPATGKTQDIANRLRIIESHPSSWTQADFDEISPYLSIHQDIRAGSADRAESIMKDGLRGGMTDNLQNLSGKGAWSWAKGLLGGDAYVFLSNKLKHLSKDSPYLAPGNVPLFHIRNEPGEDIYSAFKRADNAARNADTLDMTTAARMARAKEQGFDVDQPYYHGTNRDIESFESRRTGTREQMRVSGTHLAESPRYASRYADDKGGNVMPVYVKGPILDASKLVEKGTAEEVILNDLLKGTGIKPYWDHDGAGKMVAPPLQNYIDAVNPKKVEKILDRHGVSALRYNSKFVEPDFDRARFIDESPSVLVRNPANIRSINAAFDPANIGKNNLLGKVDPRLLAPIAAGAAGAAALMPNNAEAVGIDDLGRVVKGIDASADDIARAAKIKVFHGTPHKFPAERLVQMPDGSQKWIAGAVDQLPDVPEGATVLRDAPLGRFRLEKMGTGEGAQMYGAGHYLAEKPGVATGYRDDLSIDHGAKLVNARLSELAAEMRKYEVPGQYRKYKDPRGYELAKEYDRLIDERANYKGSLYTAEIPDADFLLWDKPLSEQPESVKKAIASMPSDLKYNLGIGEDLKDAYTGKDLTGQNLAEFLGNQKGQKQASEYLKSAGIPGIKYLDGNSRPSVWQYDVDVIGQNGSLFKQHRVKTKADADAIVAESVAAGRTAKIKQILQPEDQSYNYVLFDDDLIDIKERGRATIGGMAAAGAVGGAALAAQNIYGDSDRVRQVYDDFRNRQGQKAPFWDYLKKGGTVGEVADYAINLGAALIAPIVEAPWTLADYVSGVPAGQMAERRQQRRAQADYEPRTEAAQGWSDAAMGALGQGLAAPIHALDVVTEPIQPLAKKAWGAIGDREKMALEAGLDLIP